LVDWIYCDWMCVPALLNIGWQWVIIQRSYLVVGGRRVVDTHYLHQNVSHLFLVESPSSSSSKSSRKIREETKESPSNNRFFYFLSQTFASAGSRHLHYGKLCGWATEYIASLYTLVYIGASCCCRPKSFRHFLCCAAAVRRLI
jgi:hypothetical protein